MNIPISTIKPNPNQPRTVNTEELQSLADSIRQVGLINPIAVEDNGDGTYTLIDGERRWRACMLAGLENIEATVKAATNNNGSTRLAMATTANMQRSDMNVIEQALAIKKLMDDGYGLNEVMAITGLSKSPIWLRLNILTFSPLIQDMFAKGQLPIGTRLINAIAHMPVDGREELLTRCVVRNMTEAKILQAIQLSDAHKQHPDKWKYANRETTNQALRVDGALDMTSNKSVSELLRVNVDAVCKRCGMGSREICRNCPVTDLVDHWR